MEHYLTLHLLGAVLLILANGFFVNAEFTLVTLRQTRVRQLVEQNVTGARAVAYLQKNVDTLLSATQLGVTLAALGLGWAAEPIFLHIAEPLLHHFSLGRHAYALLRGGAVALGFLLVTFVDVVLGEVVPKSLALRYPERLALAAAVPMEAFANLTAPFLRIISGSSRRVLRLFGVHAAGLSERGHSREEISMLLSASLRMGQLAPFQEKIMQRVLDLHEVPAREIMTPRHSVIALPVDTSLEQALQFIAQHPRSRIPVYEQDLDHLVGSLYAKDLVRILSQARFRQALLQRNLRPLLRRLPVLPESKPVDQLLLEFQLGRAHLAALVDEFGTFTGVVTIEDVLEQIVGEVQDEYDLVTAPLQRVLAGEPAEIDGLTPIRDLEALYGVDFPRDDTYETLAGFLLLQLGHLPKTGEQVELPPLRFTIVDMQENRVGRVRVERRS